MYTGHEIVVDISSPCYKMAIIIIIIVYNNNVCGKHIAKYHNHNVITNFLNMNVKTSHKLSRHLLHEC